MTFQQDDLFKKDKSFGRPQVSLRELMAAFPGKLHGISVIWRKRIFFSI